MWTVFPLWCSLDRRVFKIVYSDTRAVTNCNFAFTPLCMWTVAKYFHMQGMIITLLPQTAKNHEQSYSNYFSIALNLAFHIKCKYRKSSLWCVYQHMKVVVGSVIHFKTIFQVWRKAHHLLSVLLCIILGSCSYSIRLFTENLYKQVSFVAFLNINDHTNTLTQPT
jgi:hypothetical protein